jgi:pyruvate/2-oxoglutarate dehydrogenase complex dihydrolipoamide dehydrogenase (E3) component
MTDIQSYDIVVIGSGEGGKYVAWNLAAQGRKVVVVERQYVGGSCPNIACLPSKNFIHGAKVAHYHQRAAEFGIVGGSGWYVDMALVRERKRRMVDGLREVHFNNYKRSGAELLMGEAHFIAPKTLEVSVPQGGTRTVAGESVVINTGTRAQLPAIEGLGSAAPLTHVEALELDQLPGHLIVLGGGPVGLEFAQTYRRFGSKVTLIEKASRLLPAEDPDVSAEIEQLFKDEGIELLLDTTARKVTGRSGSAVKVEVASGAQVQMLEGTHLLVAVGRAPNTERLGLEAAGIATTAQGFVQVDERLETTVPGVFAVGDCANSPFFTHVSFDDFRIVRDNLLGTGAPHVKTNRLVPWCLFTDPEVARIGLNERQARERNIEYRLARLPMAAVLRTRALAETRGFLQVLVGKQDDRILGFTAVGSSVGEMLAPIQLAMSAALAYTSLRDLILTHPTITEGLVYLFAAVPSR